MTILPVKFHNKNRIYRYSIPIIMTRWCHTDLPVNVSPLIGKAEILYLLDGPQLPWLPCVPLRTYLIK